MEACSGTATIQLIVAATIFLAAVVSLDMFWVRTADELRADVARALRKRNWLNALVAAGGAGAAALLLFGASTCSNGAF